MLLFRQNMVEYSSHYINVYKVLIQYVIPVLCSVHYIVYICSYSVTPLKKILFS
jgi:hypothetical protein